jgi:hypothetical protein
VLRSSGRAEWVEYRDPDGKWLASFPDTPMLPGKGLGVVYGLTDGSTYMTVSYHDLEPDELEMSVADRLAQGEQKVRSRASGTLEAKDSKIQGVPFRELEGRGTGFTLNGVSQPNHYLRCRIFIVGHRRYTVLGEVPFDEPERRAQVAKFIDGFRVLSVK